MITEFISSPEGWVWIAAFISLSMICQAIDQQSAANKKAMKKAAKKKAKKELADMEPSSGPYVSPLDSGDFHGGNH